MVKPPALVHGLPVGGAIAPPSENRIVGRHDLAHVPPAADDDLGGGISEGDNPREKEIVRMISRGYGRGKTLNLVRGNTVTKVDVHAEHAHAHEHEHAFTPEEDDEDEDDTGIDVSLNVAEIREMVTKAAAGVVTREAEQPRADASGKNHKREVYAKRAAEARMKGFEGDACGSCGNFTLVRNGTCMKCNTCGSTSGCS